MPTLEYFVVSRDVLVDRFSGDTSIIGVLEDFTPRQFPAIVPNVSAFSSWNFTGEDQGVEFQGVTLVRRPHTEEVIEVPFDGTGDGEGRLHILAGVANLQLEAEGEIVFEVQLNGQPRAHHRFTVRPADPNAPDRGEFFCPNLV